MLFTWIISNGSINQFRFIEAGSIISCYDYASIIVEKDSQKGIVIGAGGKRIKEIGSKARVDIERYLKQHVFLELQVKVEPGWRDELAALKTYGYKYEK